MGRNLKNLWIMSYHREPGIKWPFVCFETRLTVPSARTAFLNPKILFVLRAGEARVSKYERVWSLFD